MSLFGLSCTPERQNANRLLSTIPNEIYFYIFELIAPTTRLTPEQLGIFSNLSLVCRLFADFCLPRIFELVEMVGCKVPRSDHSYCSRVIHKRSREAALCAQIAVKQPLALAIAKTVRVCHIMNWNWGSEDVFPAKMLHSMENIRELKFLDCLVNTKHWNAIATLRSLEELSFDVCKFSYDIVWERARIKVPRFRMINGHSHTLLRAPKVVIDTRCLRTLVADLAFFDVPEVAWLPYWTALTELYIYHELFNLPLDKDWYINRLLSILIQAPKSLETLCFPVKVSWSYGNETPEMMPRIFNNPAWKNLPLLRLLTLQFYDATYCNCGDTMLLYLVQALEGIGRNTKLHSFVLKHMDIPPNFGTPRTPDFTPTQIRRMLYDKLGSSSHLKHVDIYGKVFRLVDESQEWLEVASTI